MKTQKVKSVRINEFNDIYYNTKLGNKKNWSTLFKDIIKQLDNFSTSLSFWYVADFAKGVVKAGGDCEHATPLTNKEWIGLNPWDIGQLFHPSDVSKMRSFIVFIAGYLAQKTDIERKNIKISLVFRMANAQNKYTWRKMEYPAMYYEKNQPRYLLCYITEIEHLLLNQKCVMYIYDSNSKEPTMYFSDEETINLKPLYDTKPLSEREIEVLKLLVKGLISKEIAVALKISKNTVENHKQNIFSKTKTKNIAELVGSAHKYIEQ